MPAPDPHGISIEERRNGWGVLVETFMLSGRTQRMARARRILRNLAANGWACRWTRGCIFDPAGPGRVTIRGRATDRRAPDAIR